MAGEADAKRTVRLMIETLPTVMHSMLTEMRECDEPMPMPVVHYRTLIMLAHGHSTLSALAKRQRVSLPTISATVATLVDKGWIERSVDPVDRRKQDLGVTPQGSAAMRDMERRSVELLSRSFGGLSTEQLATLDAAFGILQQVFEASKHREPAAEGEA